MTNYGLSKFAIFELFRCDCLIICMIFHLNLYTKTLFNKNEKLFNINGKYTIEMKNYTTQTKYIEWKWEKQLNTNKELWDGSLFVIFIFAYDKNENYTYMYTIHGGDNEQWSMIFNNTNEKVYETHEKKSHIAAFGMLSLILHLNCILIHVSYSLHLFM